MMMNDDEKSYLAKTAGGSFERKSEPSVRLMKAELQKKMMMIIMMVMMMVMMKAELQQTFPK